MRRINWQFVAIVLGMLAFDVWLVLYIIAPFCDTIADHFVRRMW